MEILITIITIVFAILGLILFFKVWGMTNKVNNIAKKLNCEDLDKPNWAIRRAILRGDNDLAKKLLMETFVEDVEKAAREDSTSFEITLSKVLKYYDPAFKQLGIEIPEFFKNLKKYTDVWDVIKFGNNIL